MRGSRIWEGQSECLRELFFLVHGNTSEGREAAADVTYLTTAEGTQVEFGIDAGGTQTLMVSALFTDDGCHILSWKTEYTADWEMDTTITLWDG